MTITRFKTNPLITPSLDESIGTNVNGPSLIKVPDWIENPLGKYYLYFAHHGGKHIRLAYADQLDGPWKIYQGGVLQFSQTKCQSHIASPDVHVDQENKKIRMYFHGDYPDVQLTHLAFSIDGLSFVPEDEVLGDFYFRVFKYKEWFYAIAKVHGPGGEGQLYRSKDGLHEFEKGQKTIMNQRHVAIYLKGDCLYVFLSRGLDCPESIMCSTVQLNDDWKSWKFSEPEIVLKPQEKYEGVDHPLVASAFGAIHGPAYQLRDPCIFEEDDKIYLFYSCAGESGICGSEVIF
ncbi:MAG: hypothetical protein COA79_02640 [Planctomycetota bacterium]|nr:MAG: hypothetical protein COA79_02640 [Planctomycetota bacterium]